jgi:hypothetical protein
MAMKTLAPQKTCNFINRLDSTSGLSTVCLVTDHKITNYSAKCTSQHLLVTKLCSVKKLGETTCMAQSPA